MWLPATLPLLAFLVSAPPDDKARIADLQVALQGRDVQVSFRLERGLTDQLFARIESGLPSGFEFDFVLFRDNKRWYDKTLDESNLQVVAMYNAVTREFLVNYKHDGRLIDSRVARDRVELERAMSRFAGLHVFTLGNYDPDRRLLIRARAELGPKTLFGVVPGRETTDWVRSRKFHPPPAE